MKRFGNGEEERSPVLLIEDDSGYASVFRKVIEESDFKEELRWEESLTAGLDAIEESSPDIIVTDLEFPYNVGPKVVERLVKAAPETPIVVLMGLHNMQLALASLKTGASEYFRKDELLPGLLARTLRAAVE